MQSEHCINNKRPSNLTSNVRDEKAEAFEELMLCSNSSRHCKERSLWQAVIIQAIADIGANPVNDEVKAIKKRAERWFCMHNIDFLTVCEFAGMDPKAVIMGAKKAIKISRKQNWRKRYLKKFKSFRQNVRVVPFPESA